MKLLCLLGVLLAGTLATFPMLFAGGDAPAPTPAGCGSSMSPYSGQADMAAILATIRERESGGDYQGRASGSTASGAYQFIDGTWAGFGGYAKAWLAPPEVQDAKATEHVQGILEASDGDVSAVPVVWYVGYRPAPSDPAWDRVPGAGAGNRLTPREYQSAWMDAYARHLASGSVGALPGDTAPAVETPQEANQADCVPVLSGSEQATVIDGVWAYPAPAAMFSNAPVSNPHHDYPAWDWSIPEATPVFAIRGGEVIRVSTWNDNTLDRPCNAGQSCSACGIGVTISDDGGTQWTYCHGSQVFVAVDDIVVAGTQILASGNTGRSTGPHLHLAIRTADGLGRCPQPLLASLRDLGAGVDPADLPTSGCSY